MFLFKINNFLHFFVLPVEYFVFDCQLPLPSYIGQTVNFFI